MSWRDVLQDGTAVGAVFGLHIEGIDTLFVSTVPTGPTGAAWAAPTDPVAGAGHTYTVLPVLLTDGGINPANGSGALEYGVEAGGSGEFSLAATTAVRSLFAYEAPCNQTFLADNLGYDSPATPWDRYVVTVDDSTAFAAPGYVHVGRECIYYAVKAAGQLGDLTAGNIRRGMWRWRADSKLSREMRVFQDGTRSRVVVTDKPRAWQGRRVTLLAWLTDDQGLCLDSAYRGNYEVEAWSGYILDCNYSEDWASVQIKCEWLTAPLRRQVATEPVVAVVGSEHPIRYVYAPSGKSYIQRWAVYSGGVVVAEVTNPTTCVDIGGNRIEGLYTLQDYCNEIARQINGLVQPVLPAGDSWSCWITAADVWESSDRQTYRWYQTGTAGAADLEIFVNIGGLGDVIGFPAERFEGGSWNILYPAGTTLTRVVGSAGLEPMTTLPATAVEIPVSVDPERGDIKFPRLPTTGYALIEGADSKEVIQYTGLSSSAFAPNMRHLTGVRRGLMGTTALDLPAYYVPTMPDGDTRAKITFGWGVENTDILTHVANRMVSTGTALAYGAYDAPCTPDAGYATDPACVDLKAFTDAPTGLRDALWVEGTNLEEIAGDEGRLGGWGVVARTIADGTYRLTVARWDGSTTTAIPTVIPVHTYPAPTVTTTPTALVTSCEIESNYDPAEGSSTGAPVRLRNANAVSTYGPGEVFSGALAGRVSGESGIVAAIAAAERIFYLRGRPWTEVTFFTGAAGLTIGVGDLIQFTIPRVPRPDGTTGFTGALGRVVQVDGRWFSLGNGGVAVTVRVLPSLPGIAPAGRVKAYTGGPPDVITLKPNEYVDTTDPSPLSLSPARDWHHFGDTGESRHVYIYEPGDWASGVARDITSLGGGVFELDAPVAGCAVDWIVEHQDWDVHPDAHRPYTFIADTDQKLGALDDDPALWVA